MLEITDTPPQTKLNGIFILYIAALGGPWPWIDPYWLAAKGQQRSATEAFFLANICYLSGVEKRIDCARDLPWLSGRKMTQPLLKVCILLFLWFDTENAFGKDSKCLKKKGKKIVRKCS